MPLPVSLDAVADELDGLMDESTAYVNRKTGEIMTLTVDEASLVEEGDFDEEDLPDWQRELIPKIREVLEDEAWIALPNKFDLHEWEIMRKFADHVDNARLAERLHRAIRGSGAFRMFKQVIYDAGVQEDWYSFKRQTLREIAREALEEAGIPCR